MHLGAPFYQYILLLIKKKNKKIKIKTLLSRTQWFPMGIAYVLTKFEVLTLQRIVKRERHRVEKEKCNKQQIGYNSRYPHRTVYTIQGLLIQHVL